MKKIAVIAVISTLTLGSCAFLFDDGKDAVEVETSTGKPATCKVKNGKQIWSFITPTTIRVHKDVKNLKISCSNKKAKTVGYLTVKGKSEPDVKGEYNYPEKVVIKMFVPKKVATAEAEAEYFDDELDKPLYKLPDAPEESQ